MNSSTDDVKIPSINALDLEILMHRDVHFGENFSIMLEYYEKMGVGTQPDFELKRIKQLLVLEEKEGKNLSAEYLPDHAKAKVNDAKTFYQNLRRTYDSSEESALNKLISDLILSEDEHPEKEIKALVQSGKKCVKPLIDLLKTEKFYDPLYPGYGRVPIFAAECLAQLHDEKAIPALFESLGKDHFFTDEAMIKALKSFGSCAEEFLIKRLVSKPFSNDNDSAAIALTGFDPSYKISKACLFLLEDEEIKKNPSLIHYLVLGCEGLEKQEDRERFVEIINSSLGKEYKAEANLIQSTWK